MLKRLKKLLLGNLRKQLTVGMVLVVATMISIFVWDMTRRQQAVEIAQHSEQISALASSVATSSAVWVISRDYSGLQEIIQGVSRYPNLHHAMVLDLKNQVLAHNDPTKIGLYLSELPSKSSALVLQRTASLIDATSPIMLADKQIGWVRIGLDLTPFNAQLYTLRQNGLFYGLFAIALSAFFAILASKYLTRRLYIIQRVADAVHAGKSDLRAVVPGDDEAAVLARQFNDMLDSLAKRENALKLSELHLSTILSLTPVGVFETDTSGKYIFVNHRWSEITGINAELAEGDSWSANLHPDDKERVYSEWVALVAENRPFHLEYRFLRPDGMIVWVLGQAIHYYSGHGNVFGFIGSITDITHNKLVEEEIKNKEQQLSFVLEGAELGFWDWDIAKGKVDRNKRWAEMLGYSYEEIKNTTQQWTDFIHPDDRERAWQSINEVLEGRSSSHKAEYRMLHKDGSTRWILDQANVIQRDSAANPIRMSGTHTDITERKHLEEELRHQAHFDYLTEVCSRGYFMEQAELELMRALRYGNALSLFMLDIDFFKRINDSHGHKAGDAVLVKLGEICREILREVDIIGRVGGEEFAVLLPETNKDEATEVAERLREALANTKVVLPSGGLPLYFTVSIGLSALTGKDDNLDTLFYQADKGLYQAKESGRNKVCVMMHSSSKADSLTN